jgi:hypothetical protein
MEKKFKSYFTFHFLHYGENYYKFWLPLVSSNSSYIFGYGENFYILHYGEHFYILLYGEYFTSYVMEKMFKSYAMEIIFKS